MRYKSLQTRLVLILLLVGIVPVLATVTYNYVTTFTTFEQIQVEDQAQIEQAAAVQIEQEMERLASIAEIYRAHADVRALVNMTDRERMNVLGVTLFEHVAKEHGLTHFEIGDEHGVVQFRGHNVEVYGDDKSELAAIARALQGENLSGFEYGSSGLALRAFVPIKENGQIIGTLQVGVGDEFLTTFPQLFPAVQLHVVNDAGEITLSSEEMNVGEVITAQALQVALQGTPQQVKNDEDKQIESYIPMLDPAQTNTVGALIIMQNVAALQSTMFSMLNMSVAILLLTILCAVVVAIFYSRSLTMPIKKTAGLMHVLRNGDLTQRAEAHNRQDEIGQLMTDMDDLQQTLHETISGVVQASRVVASESTVVAQSTQEVASGAEEIAQTMETLSHGIEKQTREIAAVDDIMTEFTQNLCETTTQGRQLETISQHVNQLTADGKQLMDSSNAQMVHIQHVMSQSIDKMDDLGGKVQEITSFVAIIKEVADQTNLLALNASIEAARAGEHGKGFAVVADEVRKLAEQVNASVAEIATIVVAVQHGSAEVSTSLAAGFTQVQQGTQQFSQTAETFTDIDRDIAVLAQFLSQVMAQLHEMTEEGQHIHASIQEISAITEETAASVEETTATVIETSTTMADVAHASERMADLAERLNELVKVYKI